MKRFLLLNRRPPHGTIHAQETLDVALVAGAFDQQVSLAFLDDGVYQLLKNQAPTDTRDFAAAFRALDDCGITRVYVERESLQARGLTENDLLRPVALVSQSELAEILEAQDVVLGF